MDSHLTRDADARRLAEEYRRLSYWHDSCPGSWRPRPGLPGDRDVDVAIVGAGYTGLWTAYYLLNHDPSLRVAVLERDVAGFGASGRNGGWCSAIFPASLRKVAAGSSPEAAVALQHALNATVSEVGRVIDEEGIDCPFHHAGYVSVARNRAQLQRARQEVAGWRAWGFGTEQVRFLDAGEAHNLVHASQVLGGTYTPHCASIHPARLVRGLADVVERLGATIYEGTEVLSLAPGTVRTSHGPVRAQVVVRATEGYTPLLPGVRREIAPVYSLMVATEPLSEEVLADIGLDGGSTFSDKRHLRIYGQRTSDNRIAFGGRGAPYHFGSRIRTGYDRDPRVHRMLRRILVDMFPALAGTEFTHAWGGNLGISRDWFPSLGYDQRTGMAYAGGYVGDGVATANLAGRHLAALITQRGDDELARLPWIRQRPRRWEPEPLRWIGVNAVTALFAFADWTEQHTGTPSRAASYFWKALGH